MKSLEARKRLLIAEADLQRTLLFLEIEATRFELQEAAFKTLIAGAFSSLAGALFRGALTKSTKKGGKNGTETGRPNLIGRLVRLSEVGISLWRTLQSVLPVGAVKGRSARPGVRSPIPR